MMRQRRRARSAPLRTRLASAAITACASLAIASQSAASARAEPRGDTSRVIMMIGGAVEDHADERIVRAGIASDDVHESVSLVLQFETPRRATGVKDKVLVLFPLVEEAARAVDLDSALLMAIIDVESAGDARALSVQGAAGLMQLMPATGRLYGAADRFDARQNIAAGARFLRGLLARFGNLELALAAYNAGEEAVRRFNGRIPPYRETQQYVPRVIEQYERYRQAVLALRTQSGRAASDTQRSPAPPVETADAGARRR